MTPRVSGCAVTDPRIQAKTLARLVNVAAQAGDLDRAEALARAITDPGDQVEALSGLARVAAQAGDPGRACYLAADAQALIRSITHPDAQAQAYSGVAAAIAEAGNRDEAARLLARALTLVAFSGDPGLAHPPDSLGNVLSHFFPSVMRDTWEVLVSAYTTAA